MWEKGYRFEIVFVGGPVDGPPTELELELKGQANERGEEMGGKRSERG